VRLQDLVLPSLGWACEFSVVLVDDERRDALVVIWELWGESGWVIIHGAMFEFGDVMSERASELLFRTVQGGRWDGWGDGGLVAKGRMAVEDIVSNLGAEWQVGISDGLTVLIM
jgi:hypothetical protein